MATLLAGMWSQDEHVCQDFFFHCSDIELMSTVLKKSMLWQNLKFSEILK